MPRTRPAATPRSAPDRARAARRLASALGLTAAWLAGCGPGDDPADTCQAPVLPGDLVITEVFADAAAVADASGADEGKEWFEIFNATDAAIDLTGLELRLGRPDGSSTRTHQLRAITIGAGEYLVLGNILDELRPAHVDYGYGADLGDMFNSGEGKLALGCGEATIDEAVFESPGEGQSWQFDGSALPDYTANDNPLAWCAAEPPGASEFAEENFGTPGAANQDCDVVTPGTCLDGDTMRPTVAPAIGDLVITELMANPDAVGDEVGEWFEVEVFADVDLNGLQLDRADDSRDPDEVNSGRCLHAPAGSRVVFARSAVPGEAGLPDDVEVAGAFGFTLVGGSAASPGDIQLLFDDLVLDAVTWTSATPAGTALQLDPDFTTAEDNDQERFWCDATVGYGPGLPQDLGTPGAANGECEILPPAGQCLDEGIERDIEPPAVGDLVITEYIANPAGDDGDEEWFEIVNASASPFDLNGLQLDRAGDAAAPRAIASVACLTVVPGAHAVFAHTTGAESGLPDGVVAATYTFSMPDAGDVRVLAADDTVLDALSWLNAPASRSRQLSADAYDATLNDVDDGTGALGSTADPDFCDATTTYGPTANTGTPGLTNDTCP